MSEPEARQLVLAAWRRERLSLGACRYCEGSGKSLDVYGTPTGDDCEVCGGTGHRQFCAPAATSEERP